MTSDNQSRATPSPSGLRTSAATTQLRSPPWSIDHLATLGAPVAGFIFLIATVAAGFISRA